MRPTSTRFSALLLGGMVLAGACTVTSPEADDTLGFGSDPLSQTEENAVLQLVNSASFTVLDDDVALDKRAAENIVDHRDGDDGVAGSNDDDLFDTLEELDAIPYVGASALAKLLAYAQDNGLIVAQPPSPDDALILALANTASQTVLDDDVALDKRAAENIVAHRNGADGLPNTADDDPFDTIDELDAVPYVGKSALAKMLAYAQANNVSAAPCVIISEYIEGWGAYNKAIELYNCGESPLDLSTIGVCIVRNDDTSCSDYAKLADPSNALLAPGAVWGVCRKKSFTFNDPMEHITNGCDQEMAVVMNFNGDDRLLVFHDIDDNGSFDQNSDTVLDAFGALSQVPSGYWWANMLLRRCDLTPLDGLTATSFYASDYYTQHPSGSGEHYGTPPDDMVTCP